MKESEGYHQSTESTVYGTYRESSEPERTSSLNVNVRNGTVVKHSLETTDD